jgi:molybdopterin converting factor small subunit
LILTGYEERRGFMVSVRLEVLRGLSECVVGKEVDSVFFNKEIEEGSTVGDVIRKLATEHQAFGDIIFDTQTNQLRGGVSVVLNDLLLGGLNDLDTKIKDGDFIRLFPLVMGG